MDDESEKSQIAAQVLRNLLAHSKNLFDLLASTINAQSEASQIQSITLHIGFPSFVSIKSDTLAVLSKAEAKQLLLKDIVCTKVIVNLNSNDEIHPCDNFSCYMTRNGCILPPQSQAISNLFSETTAAEVYLDELHRRLLFLEKVSTEPDWESSAFDEQLTRLRKQLCDCFDHLGWLQDVSVSDLKLVKIKETGLRIKVLRAYARRIEEQIQQLYQSMFD